MAQFMDNRVSPIKIKIWVAEVEEENHTNQAYTLTQSPLHPVRQLPASVTTFRPRKQRGSCSLASVSQLGRPRAEI